MGGLLILIAELSQGLGRLWTSRRRRTESSLARRVAFRAVGSALLGLVLARAASGWSSNQPGSGAPIFVFFPYEGEFDPSRPVQKAILRLTDFNRLSRLAEIEEETEPAEVRAVSAVHHVRRRTGREVVVETELVLFASGKATSWAWRLPVLGARDVETNLDGQKATLAIETGGQTGTVSITRAGRHVLAVRRSFATRTEAGLEVLSFPVNAIASARVLVDPPEKGKAAAVLAATGGTQLQADGLLCGRLGPAEKLELAWAGKGADAAPKQGGGSVEGVILWDIHPAGDRVRTRLTYQSARELGSVRLEHPAGLILRGARVLGSGGFVWCESTGKGEWALHVDPPLEAGGTIEIDSWMPIEVSANAAGRPALEVALLESGPRQLPAIVPVGAERFSGALGARRPGEWTGRLDPVVGSDPISDESFVKAWGSLPDEPLTLCGTRRFVRDCRASLATGPTPTRLSVKPTVGLQFEPGRVVMTVEAELSEPSGRFGQVDAALPAGLELFEVSGPGLGYWSSTARGRLRLMFDGSNMSTRRRVRLVGSIRVSEDARTIGSRQHRMAVPWIKWQDAELLAGFLAASSTSKLDVQGGTGMTVISSESSGAGVMTSPRNRLTFQVDDPRQLGEVSWASIPSRVNVRVDSQMTIHPDSIDWVAVLRYDVLGGALESIHLRMPASWSAAADLQFAGSRHQLTTETRGQTTIWTITPERPVLGSQRLVIKSSRALLAERAITHPEISPLGRGAVDACLAVVNATGRPVTIENNAGLERVDYSARFQAREFAEPTGTSPGAFRVVKESAILEVQLPREAAGAGEFREGSARVGFADVKVVVMPDGSTLGQSTYEPVAGSGSFLSFELPSGSTLLWATVDSVPVSALRSKSGSWSIALEESQQGQVRLIWQTSPTQSRASGSNWPLGLPRAGHGLCTDLVTIYVPDQFALAGEVGGLRRTSLARLEMARADWLLRSINEFVQRMDRSSNRDHQKLVTLLIAHEMRLRSAPRGESRAVDAGEVESGVPPETNPAWIKAARASRVEAVRKAGLQRDLEVANRYLGDGASSPVRATPGVPEPSALSGSAPWGVRLPSWESYREWTFRRPGLRSPWSPDRGWTA